jgi:hypothetical protein
MSLLLECHIKHWQTEVNKHRQECILQRRYVLFWLLDGKCLRWKLGRRCPWPLDGTIQYIVIVSIVTTKCQMSIGISRNQNETYSQTLFQLNFGLKV